MENLSNEQAAELRDKIIDQLRATRQGRGVIRSIGLFSSPENPEAWGVSISMDREVSDEAVLRGVPEQQHDNVRIRRGGAVRAHLDDLGE